MQLLKPLELHLLHRWSIETALIRLKDSWTQTLRSWSSQADRLAPVELFLAMLAKPSVARATISHQQGPVCVCVPVKHGESENWCSATYVDVSESHREKSQWRKYYHKFSAAKNFNAHRSVSDSLSYGKVSHAVSSHLVKMVFAIFTPE